MSDTHPIHYSRPQKLVEAEEAIVTENAKAREFENNHPKEN